MQYNSNVDNDILAAAKNGSQLVEKLNRLFRGNIYQTEQLSETVAEMLDMYAGIDAFYQSENAIAGVALRIQQHSNKNWETFTIRFSRPDTGAATEYEKRKQQIYNNAPSFYPHYTCQAYLNDRGDILGGAFCQTKDLYDITIGYEPFNYTRTNSVYLNRNSSDGHEFLVVPFELFETENKKIIFF